jgi:uncharacterized repeat protein (TIGR03806 family)
MLSWIIALPAGLQAEGPPAAGTLTLPAYPPETAYGFERVFHPVQMWGAVSFVQAPGDADRLFIPDKYGFINLITNLETGSFTRFLSLTDRVYREGESGLLGLAFDPDYQNNRRFYVFYTAEITVNGETGLHDILSRFETDPDNPNRALLESETYLITQRDEDMNHNGGDLHFGPDGYLYISLGDEGGAYDRYDNSQRIDKDFFSGILRLDVAMHSGNLTPNPHPAVHPGTYLVPADNPFVGATEFAGSPVDPDQVRTEFYAVGLRNPWRFSFDPVTGELICNDVGQERREEINIIVPGGNYGWAAKEGTLPGPRAEEFPQLEGLIDPLFEYSHDEGRRAIVSSLPYYGDVYPELHGAYLFSDWSGSIGALWRLANGALETRWIANVRHALALGVHPRTGHLLVTDTDFHIRRFVRLPDVGTPLPERLSETGAFTNLATLEPAPGVIPYDINVPFWSDYALKTRFFALTDPAGRIGFHIDGNWDLPTGMVWVKHFDFEMVRGDPGSRRRLETRFLVRNDDGVYGITYRWNIEQTEAFLVPPEGADETLLVQVGEEQVEQQWRYPSRNECVTCHTAQGGLALGFNTAQMNRDLDYGDTHYGDGPVNQLEHLSQAGYFAEKVTTPQLWYRLARADDEAWSREYRARSFLTANCAYCHQPGGGRTLWDARIQTPLSQQGIINGQVINESSQGAAIVTPGDLEESAIYRRLAEFNDSHMPPLATAELNLEGLELLRGWIEEDLPGRIDFAKWQERVFVDPEAPEAQPDGDPDLDTIRNYAEFLLDENPHSPEREWRLRIHRNGSEAELEFQRLPNRFFLVEWTADLTGAGAWEPLDDPANRLVASAQTETVRMHLPLPATGQRYFRVLIREP